MYQQLPLDEFPWNLTLGTFINTIEKIQDLVKTGQKYQAHHVNIKVCFVTGDIKFP